MQCLRIVAVLVSGLALSGCTPSVEVPSVDVVAERLRIEYPEDATLPASYMDGLFHSLAEDALNGRCGSAAYESILFQDSSMDDLFYAWRVTCSMYFAHDLSPQQLEDAKNMVFGKVIEDIQSTD